MEIEDEKGNGFFLQPCSKYCDGCSIYSDRPRECAKFECGLLTSVDKKEMEFDTAIDIINEVKLRKKSIESKVGQLNIELKSPSFYFKILELKKVLNEGKISLSQNNLELMAELKQLDELIIEKFGISLD